ASEVENKETFIIFLKTLIKDFEKNTNDWDNAELSQFLEGIYGYSLDKAFPAEPSWKEFAEILIAARVYE
ncbi:MAG: hypothetical protein AAFP19_26445, partial [Bacteroidota bacterium]